MTAGTADSQDLSGKGVSRASNADAQSLTLLMWKVSTLLPTSLALFLALTLTVTNDSADSLTASALHGRSARMLTGTLAITTLFSLRRNLFFVLAVIGSVDVTVTLHLREKYENEEAQLALRMPSGRQTGFETCRVWYGRENWSR